MQNLSQNKKQSAMDPNVQRSPKIQSDLTQKDRNMQYASVFSHLCDVLRDCSKYIIHSNEQVWMDCNFLSKCFKESFDNRSKQAGCIMGAQTDRIVDQVCSFMNSVMKQSFSRIKRIEAQLTLKITQQNKDFQLKMVQWQNQKDSLTQSVSQSQLMIDSLNKNLKLSEDIHASLLKQIDHLKQQLVWYQRSSEIASKMSPQKLAKTQENMLQMQKSSNSRVFKLQKQVQSLRRELVKAEQIIIQIKAKEIQFNRISNQRENVILRVKNQYNVCSNKNKKIAEQNQILRFQNESLRKKVQQAIQQKQRIESINAEHISRQNNDNILIDQAIANIDKRKCQQLQKQVKRYRTKNPHSPLSILIQKISQQRTMLYQKIKELETKELQIIQYLGTILDIVYSEDQWLQQALKYLESTETNSSQELYILNKIFECIQDKSQHQSNAENSQYRQNRNHSKFLQVENQIKLLAKGLKNNQQSLINHCEQLWTDPQYLKNKLGQQISGKLSKSKQEKNSFKAIQTLKIQLQRYLSLILVQFISRQNKIKQQWESKINETKRYYEGVVSQFELQKDDLIENIGRNQMMIDSLKRQIKSMQSKIKNRKSYIQETPFKIQSSQGIPTTSKRDQEQGLDFNSSGKQKQILVQSLKRHILQKEQLINNLKISNQELEYKFQKAKKKHVQSIDQINQKIKSYQEAVSQFLNYNNQLSHKIKITNQHNKQIQSQLNMLKQENECLKQKLLQTQSRFNLKNNTQQITLELQSLQRQFVLLHQQLERKSKYIISLQEQLNRKIQQNGQILRLLESKQISQINSASNTDRVVQQAIKDVKGEDQIMRQQIQKLKVERDDILLQNKQKAISLTWKMQEYEQKNTRLTQEIINIQKKLKIALTELDQLRQGFGCQTQKGQEDQVNILKSEIQDLREQIGIYIKAINNNQASFLDLRQQNYHLKQIVQKYSQQIKILKQEKQQNLSKFVNKQIQIKVDGVATLGLFVESLKRDLQASNHKNQQLDRILNESEVANKIAYQQIQMLLKELQKFRRIYSELTQSPRAQIQQKICSSECYSSQNKQMRVSLEIQLLNKERQQIQDILRKRLRQPFKGRTNQNARELVQIQHELVGGLRHFKSIELDQCLQNGHSKTNINQNSTQYRNRRLRIIQSVEIASSQFESPNNYSKNSVSQKFKDSQSVVLTQQQGNQHSNQQKRQLKQQCVIDKNKLDRDNYKKKIVALEQRVRQLQNNEQQSQIILVKYKDQIKNLKKQSQSKYQNLHKQIADLGIWNQQLKEQNSYLQGELQRIQLKSQKQAKRQSVHNKQLIRIQSQEQALKIMQGQQAIKEKQQLKRQNQLVRSMIKDLTTRFEQKHKQFVTVNQQYLSTKEEIETLKQSIEHLQNEMDQMKRIADGLKREKNKIIEDFSQKQRQLLNQSKQKSYSQLLMLQQQNRSLRGQIDEQAGIKFKELKAMQNDKIQMAKKIRSQNLRIDELQSKERHLQSQITDLRRTHLSDQQNQRKLARELEILMHEKLQIQRDVKRIQENFGRNNQKLEKENQLLRNQVENTNNQKQLKKLQQLLNLKEKSIYQLKSQCSNLQRRNQALEEQHLKQMQRIQQLQGIERYLKSQIQLNDSKLQKNIQQIKNKNEQVNRKQSQLKHMKSQFLKFEIRINQTAEQLTSLYRQNQFFAHQLQLKKQSQLYKIMQLKEQHEKEMRILKQMNDQLKKNINEFQRQKSSGMIQASQKCAELNQRSVQVQNLNIKISVLEEQAKSRQRQFEAFKRSSQQNRKNSSLQIASLKAIVQDLNNVIKAMELGANNYQKITITANQVTILQQKRQAQLLKEYLRDQKEENQQNKEQIKRYRILLQQLKSKLTVLQGQNTGLKNRVSTLQNDLSRKENQLSRQKRNVQKQKRELQYQFEQAREENSWKQRKAQDTIANLQKQNKNLSSQLERYQKQVLNIQSTSSSELFELKKANLKLQYQCQQKSKTVDNIQEQVKRLQNQLKISNNQVDRLDRQKKESLGIQRRLKDQILNLKSKVKDVEREKEDECVKSIRTIDQQKLLISDFTKQLEQLTIRAHDKNERHSSYKKISILNKKDTDLENQTDYQFNQKLKQSQNLIKKLRQNNQQYKKTNYQLQRDNQQKQHKLLSILDDNDELSRKLHVAQQQLLKKQSSIKLYQKQIQRYNNEAQIIKQTNLKGEKQSLQAQLKARSQQISQLNKKNRSLLMQKNNHLELIEKLKYQINSLTKNQRQMSQRIVKTQVHTSPIKISQIQSRELQQQSNNHQRILKFLRRKREEQRLAAFDSPDRIMRESDKNRKQEKDIVGGEHQKEEVQILVKMSKDVEQLVNYKLRLQKQCKSLVRQKQSVRISLIREIEEAVDSVIMYIYQNGIINSNYQIHKFRFEETTNSFGSISPMSVPQTFPSYLQKYFCKLFSMIFNRTRTPTYFPENYKLKEKS